jgi:transposase
MLQMSPSTRIFVCIQLVDFRKGIDGLAAVCRNKLDQDPFQGAIFVFRNRGRTTIRLLVYDGQGFWLCTKRLSKGTFRWWPKGPSSVDARQLQTLLWNGNPESAQFSDNWRKVVVS